MVNELGKVESRVRRIQLFLSCEYGSYLLHICLCWYIRKHNLLAHSLIFASKYSHKFTYEYSIWCKTNTCWSKYSLQSKYLLHIFSYWANICLKIFILKHIYAKLQEVSHSSKKWLANICILANFCYILLQIK